MENTENVVSAYCNSVDEKLVLNRKETKYRAQRKLKIIPVSVYNR